MARIEHIDESESSSNAVSNRDSNNDTNTDLSSLAVSDRDSNKKANSETSDSTASSVASQGGLSVGSRNNPEPNEEWGSIINGGETSSQGSAESSGDEREESSIWLAPRDRDRLVREKEESCEEHASVCSSIMNGDEVEDRETDYAKAVRLRIRSEASIKGARSERLRRAVDLGDLRAKEKIQERQNQRLEEARLKYIAEQDRILREMEEEKQELDSAMIDEDVEDVYPAPRRPAKKRKSAVEEPNAAVVSELKAHIRELREEQAYMRQLLSEKIAIKKSSRESKTARKSRAKKVPRFRVPKQPPVLKGKAEELVAWIQEMEVECVNYTTGKQRKVHNKDFISKLRPFFEPGSLVQSWFVTYVSTRLKARLKLTWEKLIRDLSQAFDILQHEDNAFDDYYLGEQTTTVADFVHRMNMAALKTDELTPNLRRMGFLRGLKPDVQSYVRLQRPKTVAEAQKLATDWENAHIMEAKKRGRTPKGSRARGAREYTGEEDNGRKRRSAVLSTKAQKALDNLRAFKLNKCYKCGDATHKPHECKAKSEVREKWRAEIAALKEKIDQARKE